MPLIKWWNTETDSFEKEIEKHLKCLKWMIVDVFPVVGNKRVSIKVNLYSSQRSRDKETLSSLHLNVL